MPSNHPRRNVLFLTKCFIPCCTSKACWDLREVVSKIKFSFFPNLVLLYTLNVYLMNITFDKKCLVVCWLCWEDCWLIVRLWSSFLRLENLILQTLLKVSQDALWTASVCSMGMPLPSPVTSLYFYSEPWRQVGWNWKWDEGGGKREKQKESLLLEFQIHPIARRKEVRQTKFT